MWKPEPASIPLASGFGTTAAVPLSAGNTRQPLPLNVIIKLNISRYHMVIKRQGDGLQLIEVSQNFSLPFLVRRMSTTLYLYFLFVSIPDVHQGCTARWYSCASILPDETGEKDSIPLLLKN